MYALAARYDGYAWERNSGYGTAAHRAALDERGLTPHHRRSFCLDDQVALLLDPMPPNALDVPSRILHTE
jgi:ribonuclease HII